MTKRRKERRIALEVIYQQELTRNPLDVVIKNKLRADDLGMLPKFSQELIDGVKEHQLKIDETIENCADNWSLSRMPYLDRNILRIGLFEMLWVEDVPISVSINEAVELAKKYSTEDSGKFVNGILGKIALTISGKEGNTKKKEKTSFAKECE